MDGNQGSDSSILLPSSIDWKSMRLGSRDSPRKMKFNRSIGSILRSLSVGLRLFVEAAEQGGMMVMIIISCLSS